MLQDAFTTIRFNTTKPIILFRVYKFKSYGARIEMVYRKQIIFHMNIAIITQQSSRIEQS